MKLLLEALSPTEGTGIVRSGNLIRLIRPPYKLITSPVLSEEAIGAAISKYGYFAASEEFGSFEDLIAFLNQTTSTSRTEEKLALPESISADSVLELAPMPVLNTFLDRVENELIPIRSFDHAENILIGILGLDLAARDAALRNRTVDLLKRTKQARLAAVATLRKCEFDDVRFSSLKRHNQVEKCARRAALIREQGCMFACS
jgi:hypothetical protein